MHAQLLRGNPHAQRLQSGREAAARIVKNASLLVGESTAHLRSALIGYFSGVATNLQGMLGAPALAASGLSGTGTSLIVMQAGAKGDSKRAFPQKEDDDPEVVASARRTEEGFGDYGKTPREEIQEILDQEPKAGGSKDGSA